MEFTSEPVNKALFDLADPASAYVFGFLQADGTHTAGPGRKGRVSVEIKADDVQLLRDIQQVLPWRTSISFRARTTNFSSSACSHAVLNMCMLEGRTRLLELGLPVGRKSAIIAPPTEPFSHSDYLRGIIDADGSVGFTARGWPFISLVTASPAIATFTCAALAVAGWKRPAGMRVRGNYRRWTPAEDAVVLRMSIKDA